MQPRATRGYGVLEEFLARRRAAMVERLIPTGHRTGCIVDIGCGSYPAFLKETTFSRKVGLDRALDQRLVEEFAAKGLCLIQHDLERDPVLPLENESSDVVMMTAVVEHLRPDTVPLLLSEIFRVLKPGGLCIITTPAPWTQALLGCMAKVRLVSSDEIEEHQASYDCKALRSLLASAGFPAKGLRGGRFELGMNCWAVAVKTVPERGLP